MPLQRVQKLFEEYKDMVYRLALSYLGNPEDAQDMSQEVFMRLLRWIDRIKPGSERAWLTRVTINCCKDLLSSCLSTREIEETDLVCLPQSNDLKEALMALPGDYRIVIYLHYYEAYSTAEIAKILKVSQSVVTTRLHRARQRLKNLLQEETV